MYEKVIIKNIIDDLIIKEQSIYNCLLITH